jgi:acyl carrier protein
MIKKRTIECMVRVFDVPAESINETTSQKNLDKWDSLNHLNLMIELEEEFDISFEPEEIAQMITFLEIVAMIERKMDDAAVQPE